MDGCVSRCLKLPKLQRAGRCRNEIRLRLQVLESGGPKTAPKQLQWWSRKKKTWKKTSCPQKRNQNYMCRDPWAPCSRKDSKGLQRIVTEAFALQHKHRSHHSHHRRDHQADHNCPRNNKVWWKLPDPQPEGEEGKEEHASHRHTHTHSPSYPLSFLTWTSLGDPWSHHTCKNTVIRALPLFILVSHANSQAPRLLPLTSANYSCCYLYSHLWIDLMIWRLTINIRP